MPAALASPYGDDWSGLNQYKTSLHLHTSNSDGGSTPATRLEQMYNLGFDIVALTDHNYLTTSPTSANNGITQTRYNQMMAGDGRDGQGMIVISKTTEASDSHHINTFFTNGTNNLNNALVAVKSQPIVDGIGGIGRLNHPGRHTGADGAGHKVAGANISNTPNTINTYVNWFMDNPRLVGMEIINKLDGESASDRILWDNVLLQTLSQGENSRNVWAFSENDYHDSMGRQPDDSFNMFLMPELTEKAFHDAMLSGSFYAVAKVAKRELGTSSPPPAGTPTPIINDIVVAGSTLTMSTENVNRIDWISEGKVIGTGEVLDVKNNPNVGIYVRADALGAGGIAFTQAIVTGYDRAVPGMGAQTTFDGDVQTDASFLANSSNRTNVVVNSQHIVGGYYYDAYVMHNSGTIGNAEVIFGTLSNNSALTNATVSNNGTLVNNASRTVSTVTVGAGGYVDNEGTVSTLTMTGGTFFNDRSTVGTSSGTTDIGGTGWFYNAAGRVNGTVNVSENGAFENCSALAAISNVTVSGNGTVYNYGTSSEIAILTMNDDCIVHNAGTITEVIYNGGTYINNVNDKYTNSATGTPAPLSGMVTEIDTLTLAGDASGIGDWGNVGSLKFDGSGTGVLIVSAFAGEGDSGFTGINATSVNFAGGNIVLDLSGVEGILGDDFWADVFLGTFGNDDGFYLSTLVGASELSGVDDLCSLEVAWGDDSFSIFSDGVFGAGWDIDSSTGFVSYRSMA